MKSYKRMGTSTSIPALSNSNFPTALYVPKDHFLEVTALLFSRPFTHNFLFIQFQGLQLESILPCTPLQKSSSFPFLTVCRGHILAFSISNIIQAGSTAIQKIHWLCRMPYCSSSNKLPPITCFVVLQILDNHCLKHSRRTRSLHSIFNKSGFSSFVWNTGLNFNLTVSLSMKARNAAPFKGNQAT